jgi:hypothetical protein
MSVDDDDERDMRSGEESVSISNIEGQQWHPG